MPVLEQRSTARFILKYDPAVPGAQTLAQTLGDHIESDFHRLLSYFPVEDEQPGNAFEKHPTLVFLVVPSTSGVPASLATLTAGGALNRNAYLATFRSGEIYINVTSGTGANITLDYARFLFIAEMAEQLMVVYNYVPGGNLQGAHRGEALSRIMAEELFPAQASVWVNAWLNSSPRLDYIDANPAPTPTLPQLGGDSDPAGYGAGILFINYLRHQLGYSLYEIIQAGGVTFRDTYDTLTGRPADDPNALMTALLDKHLPTFAINLLTNNPFPLYEGTERGVFTALSSESKVSASLIDVIAEPRYVDVSPFRTCAARRYRYWYENRVVTNSVLATCEGFLLPRFQWKVGAQYLYAAKGTFSHTVEVFVAHPDGSPSTDSGQKVVTFDYEITEIYDGEGKRSRMRVTNREFPGRFRLEMTVEVNETRNFEAAKSLSMSLDFDARDVRYEQRYYADRLQCATHDIVANIPHVVVNIHNIPRPHPNEVSGMVALLDAIESVRDELRRVGEQRADIASRAAAYASIVTGLPSSVFFRGDAGVMDRPGPHDVTMARHLV